MLRSSIAAMRTAAALGHTAGTNWLHGVFQLTLSTFQRRETLLDKAKWDNKKKASESENTSWVFIPSVAKRIREA
jgi:hypothetical protein